MKQLLMITDKETAKEVSMALQDMLEFWGFKLSRIEVFSDDRVEFHFRLMEVQ